MRVHPVFIPADSLLAEVDGVYNAILVEGDLVGQVLFYGEGAGASATSSAVVADNVGLEHIQSLLRPAGLFSGDVMLTAYAPSRSADSIRPNSSSAARRSSVSPSVSAVTARGTNLVSAPRFNAEGS